MTRRSDYFTKVLQKVGDAFSIFKKEAGKGEDTDHPAVGPTALKAHSAD
jgi:hypothetical protein